MALCGAESPFVAIMGRGVGCGRPVAHASEWHRAEVERGDAYRVTVRWRR